MHETRILSIAVAAALVAGTAAAASGAVAARIASGDRVVGTVGGPGEGDETDVETFRFVCPRDAAITVQAKGPRKGPPIEVRIRSDVAATAAVGSGPNVRVAAAALGSGEHVVEVRCPGADTPVPYKLVVTWKSRRKWSVTAPTEAGAVLGLTFAAAAGSKLTLSTTASRPSSALPLLDSLTPPAADAVVFEAPQPARITLSGDETGEYVLTARNTADAAGEVTVAASARAPSVPRRKLDLRESALQPDLGEITAQSVPRSGGTVRAPETSPIAGAAIDVPPGALTFPTAILVAPAPEIEPVVPEGEDRTVGGDAVFFGPEGTNFKEPVTITLPYNPAAVGDDTDLLRVVRRDQDGGITEVIDPLTVDPVAATVSFPATHFSAYQVFVARRPIVVASPLVSPDVITDAGFGADVAILGDEIHVGAPFQDGSGGVFVFGRQRTGTWTPRQTIAPDDPGAGDRFGVDLARSGDTLVVGSLGDDVAGTDSGSAYVFVRGPSGTWTQQQKLVPDTAAAFDDFGITVAVDGDTALVGAWHSDAVAGDGGAAYVFTRDGAGMWTQRQRLTQIGAAGGDTFGVSVALIDGVAVIGAYQADIAGSNSGAAYVFTRDLSGVWSEAQRLLASDGAAGAQFGTAVAISGDTIVVGANRAAFARGEAYVFRQDVGGGWVERQKLRVADVPETSEGFGIAVAIDGGTIVVGDWFGDDYFGSAHVYTRDGGGVWSRRRKLFATTPQMFSAFGYAVAVSGDTVVVGAESTVTGSADVFENAALGLDP